MVYYGNEVLYDLNMERFLSHYNVNGYDLFTHLITDYIDLCRFEMDYIIVYHDYNFT